MAERVRTAISRRRILPNRRVTISGGVSSCPQDATTREELQRLGGPAGRRSRELGLAETVNWKPVIAAVHGYALGLGYMLTMSCDLVVAADGRTVFLPGTRTPGANWQTQAPRPWVDRLDFESGQRSRVFDAPGLFEQPADVVLRPQVGNGTMPPVGEHVGWRDLGQRVDGEQVEPPGVVLIEAALALRAGALQEQRQRGRGVQVQVLFHLSRGYRDLGEFEQAAEALDVCWELDAHNEPPAIRGEHRLACRGELALRCGDVETALATCRVMICLCSTAYINSEYCGKELTVFSQRVRAYTQAGGLPKAPSLILPVLYGPPSAAFPSVIRELQYSGAGLPVAVRDLYQKEGLRYLLKLKENHDALGKLVTQLARDIVTAFLSSQFAHDAERHVRRVHKISELDRQRGLADSRGAILGRRVQQELLVSKHSRGASRSSMVRPQARVSSGGSSQKCAIRSSGTSWSTKPARDQAQ